jgi:prepilin-type N-terminal cleavage/methylation domain-containing protein
MSETAEPGLVLVFVSTAGDWLRTESGRSGTEVGRVFNQRDHGGQAATGRAQSRASKTEVSGSNQKENGTALGTWCRLKPKMKRHVEVGSDAGFTLIELLIVIVILPVVVGGIAAAMIGIFQNEETTFNRVADSADAQITSANFNRDVQSAFEVSTGSPFGGSCGWFPSSSQPTGSKELLNLTWGTYSPRSVNDGVLNLGSSLLTSVQAHFTESDVGSLISDGNVDIPSKATIASFVPPNSVTMSAPATGTNRLDTVAILTSAAVVTYWSVPVVSGTSGAGSPIFVYDLQRRFCTQEGAIALTSTEVVAHDLPPNQGVASVNCITPCPNLSSNWVFTSNVSSISLSDNEPLSGFQLNLSATPRYSSVAGGNVVPPVLVTGAGSSVNLPSPSDSLNINGTLAFNSSSGSLATGAIGAQLNATNGIVENSCTTSCAAATSSFAGTCAGLHPCPAATSIATVTVPTASPPVGPSAATGPVVTSCNTTCQPGYYPNNLSISGNVTFAPGSYLFAGSVTIGGAPGSLVTFGSGQYTFNQGMTVTSPNISLIGNGIFFYFASPMGPSCTACSLTLNSGDNVQLAPLASGPYAGLLIYQPVTNTSTMSLVGTGPGTNTYGGAIEASGSLVNLGSNGDTFSLGSLVAGSVSMGTNVSVTVQA